ncbi:hypothetical protein PHISP_04970 [Aspergillus sp. HF37]|nr:hypothetical protein PHISP_04970 [Aspergillus sp. HF37]
MCEHFGLECGPAVEEDKEWKDIDKWWFVHQAEYHKMCEECGLQKRNIGPDAPCLSGIMS